MKFKGLVGDTAGWPNFKHTNSLKEKIIGIKVEMQSKDDTSSISSTWSMEYVRFKKKKVSTQERYKGVSQVSFRARRGERGLLFRIKV